MIQNTAITVNGALNPEADAAQKAHDQKMLEASKGVTITSTDRTVDGQQVVTHVQNGEPPKEAKLLAGKYKSPEDLEKAYIELQRKLGAGVMQGVDAPKPNATTDEPAPKPAAEPPKDVPTPQAQQQTNVVEKAAAEYADSKTISEATLAELEKVGISRDTVARYVAGIEAEAQLAEQTAFGVTSGKDGYEAMVSWAATNLPASEIAKFDEAVTKGKPSDVKVAVQGLWARYQQANGFEPAGLVGGKGAAGGGAQPYLSRAQMQADMSNPQYRTDAAFRDMVMARVAAANAAGINLFV